MVWYSHLFKNFPQLVVIHTVKGFNVEARSMLVSATAFSPCLLPSSLFLPVCVPLRPGGSVHLPLPSLGLLLHLFCYQGLSTLLYSLSPPS